jgi:outer membrane lipoprotein-sorting protein
MRLALLACALLCLAACAESSPPPPVAPQPTVLDDQIKAIERAEAVEGELIQQQKDQDQAMEDQGG